ncbi:MAG: hypothetical protein RLZZ387_1545 [Chloroflexota bacterium]
MSFLDNISRKIGEGVERAKQEAEKLQRVLSLQNELGELKRQLDGRRMEFGDRSLELYRAGKIQSPTLGEIMRAMEQLQVSITLKEEELKIAQGQPGGPPPPQSQSVPVSVETPPQTYQPPPQTYQPPPQVTQTQPGSAPGTKVCPTCSFQMPNTAVFCPNCGLRVGA